MMRADRDKWFRTLDILAATDTDALIALFEALDEQFWYKQRQRVRASRLRGPRADREKADRERQALIRAAMRLRDRHPDASERQIAVWLRQRWPTDDPPQSDGAALMRLRRTKAMRTNSA